MKGLVVYDFVFGNTEKIAQAIGAVLAEQGSVQTLPVGKMTVDSMSGLDILIVGSPTRGFRPTEAVSKFLNSIPKNSLTGMRVAAFDTRHLAGHHRFEDLAIRCGQRWLCSQLHRKIARQERRTAGGAAWKGSW